MQNINEVKTRDDFPKLPDEKIDWDKVWKEPDNCNELGHIWQVFPMNEKGIATCYKCKLNVENKPT